MFGETLKSIRQERGLSQQEVAEQLHVVRQTVSKWEKGLSVPDADLLVKLADILQVDAAQLLKGDLSGQGRDEELVRQLVEINSHLAEKNRRARRIWKAVGIGAALLLLGSLLLVIVGSVVFTSLTHQETSVVSEPLGE